MSVLIACYMLFALVILAMGWHLTLEELHRHHSHNYLGILVVFILAALWPAILLLIAVTYVYDRSIRKKNLPGHASVMARVSDIRPSH
jgi:predicted Na+-dependent transporter